MRRRCPESRPLGPAALPGHTLRIALPKSAAPGPGWAAAVAADAAVPDEGARLPGALWLLHPGDLPALDSYEDYPGLYARENLRVETDEGPADATVYLMREPLRPAAPAPEYAEILRRGYADFDLPIEILERALSEAEKTG
jgi:hypothetical protein